jgi:ATP-dependent DNA ligase
MTDLMNSLGIIEPCLPSSAKAPPNGPGWLHKIKHDGMRIMARRDGAGVQRIIRLFCRDRQRRAKAGVCLFRG